jgi:hypothetical protein
LAAGCANGTWHRADLSIHLDFHRSHSKNLKSQDAEAKENPRRIFVTLSQREKKMAYHMGHGLPRLAFFRPKQLPFRHDSR